MKTKFIQLLAFLILIAFSSCTKKTSSELKSYEQVEVGYGEQKSTEVTTSVGIVKPNEENPANITLADMLRRVPGVYITGEHPNVSVQVRGASSAHGQQEPLFVLDGHPIGNSYGYAAYSVDINDIKSVSVLKDAGSNIYGVRGSAGVIVIKTRKK